MSGKGAKSMEQLILDDGRYPPEAYAFLHAGLAKAVHQIHGNQPVPADQRHVSGRELCLALRDLAIERWGQLAAVVLGKWRINTTRDFGNMVFLLVEAGYMKATDQDSVDDFCDVYSFDEAFGGQGQFDLTE